MLSAGARRCSPREGSGVPPLDLPALGVGERLLAAALCGAIVGFDREVQGKAAGLRTHILLAVGAAMFLILAAPSGPTSVARVLQGLVGGLGFLSAGQIMRRGLPTGVTTAADLWVVGAVGAACGLGLYVPAALATGAVFVILRGLGFVERVLEGRKR